MNARNATARKKQYKDLLGITKTVIGYAQVALLELEQYGPRELTHTLFAMDIAKELAHYIPLALQVVEQTERRVINGEAMPAAEKIVSIFEEHTDRNKKRQTRNPLRSQGMLDRRCFEFDSGLSDPGRQSSGFNTGG
jgi:hypothetical protein